MQFSGLSDHLNQLLNAVELEFASKPLSWWDEPYAPGKWQRRQLAGHLIDSAANNQQRFVRSILATAEGPATIRKAASACNVSTLYRSQ